MNRILVIGGTGNIDRPVVAQLTAAGAWWAPQIRRGDVVRWPYLAAPTAPIDERDVASVAVRALLERGHAGSDYVLTGPQSLTQSEQLSTIGRAIGRSVRIEMLLKSWNAAIGQPAHVTNTVAEVTGTAPRTFFEWASDHAQSFA